MVSRNSLFVLTYALCIASMCAFASDDIDVSEPPLVETKTPLYGARVNVADLQAEVERLKASLAVSEKLAKELGDELNERNANAPPIEIGTLLANAKPEYPDVQMIVTSSEKCTACPPFWNAVVAYANTSSGWTYGEDPSSMIWHEVISEAEWVKRGYTLPHVDFLVRGGVREAVGQRDVRNLFALYKMKEQQYEKSPSRPEPLAGMVMKTIQGKAQATQLLQTLGPLLDGGTLRISYTAKPGVIKEYLTIKQGATGIKLPPKLELVLSMYDGNLTVTMIDPKPVAIAGPFERGVQAIELTPNKLSIRLPWMIDPEVGLK